MIFMETPKIQHKAINYAVYLNINTKNGKPALEIRRLTTDPDIIKIIIDAAFFEKPIIVFPVFRERLRAIATLSKRGIIKYNGNTGSYSYLI